MQSAEHFELVHVCEVLVSYMKEAYALCIRGSKLQYVGCYCSNDSSTWYTSSTLLVASPIICATVYDMQWRTISSVTRKKLYKLN